MTEPPGPRSPGDDDSPGEPDPDAEFEEFSNYDMLDEIADDYLLDRLGSNNPPQPSDEEIDEADRELTDFAGRWRDDIDSEPLGPLVSDKQAQDIVTGEIARMSIQENAALLGTIANDLTAASALKQCGEDLDRVQQAVQGAKAHIDETAPRAAGLLGGEEGDALNGQGQQLGSNLGDLLGKVAQLIADVTQETQNVLGFNQAMRDAAERHGG